MREEFTSEETVPVGLDAEYPSAEERETDPRYADTAKNPKRTERVVAVSFVVAIIAICGLGAAFWVNASGRFEGTLMGIALGALGVGTISWGKYLMPQGPFVEERHPLSATPEEEADLAEAFDRGAKPIARRSFLGKLFGLAGAALGAFLIFPLRSFLGKDQPGNTLYHTDYRPGSRLVALDGKPVKVSDLEVGGVLTVFPEGFVGSAVSQTVLIRPSIVPTVTKPGREHWSPSGYLAFSKVCTHAGCPVGLYEEQFEQLLCPCHQSVFDVKDGAQPIFGPAPRPLPQLPLMADSGGYLVARSDFTEPIGPGFWSRGAL